jgi:serine/threonine-protein kinase
MRDLADILEHAHRRGVIHRGLRPDRIVMTSQRRYPLCIPDWSEAIAHDASASVPPPDGSRAYLAPELVHQDAGGAERVDDRADMFALGAIAYRALTGTLPFNPVAANVPYLAARTRRPETPRELATIIDSLLSFDRFDRPSASEVRTDLDLLLGSLPDLQRHAAPRVPQPRPDFDEDVEAESTAPPVATSARADVSRGTPRVRRPRWTPTVQYVDSTDVDIIIDDDAPVG